MFKKSYYNFSEGRAGVAELRAAQAVVGSSPEPSTYACGHIW